MNKHKWNKFPNQVGESPFNLSSCIPTLKVDTPKECYIFKMKLERRKYVWVKWSWYQWKLGLNDGFWVEMIKNRTRAFKVWCGGVNDV
jgi:hypothetical protein